MKNQGIKRAGKNGRPEKKTGRSGNGSGNAFTGSDPTNLRRRAEALLDQQAVLQEELHGLDLEMIIHELSTYQIELELQNEDLKSAQAELDASRRKYVDLYDHAPVGYLTFDPTGRIQSVNLTAAQMLGGGRSDLLRTPFPVIVAEKDRDAFFLHLRRTVREGKRQSVELELVKNNGRPFHVHLESVPALLDDGRVAEVRTTVMDITEKKKKELEIMNLNRELLRSNEDLLHFAFIVSHDLQEPLRTISGFVQLLERRYNDLLDDKGHLFMSHIVEGTCHMQNLLNDLLTYSRVGGGELNREPVSLNKVLQDIKDNLAGKIAEKRAEITSAQLPVVCGDEALFKTLLQNLVGNSLKYHSEEPPLIHISAERDQDRWLICVRDNGIGIDSQYADQIFLIFQRLHLRNEYEGTGIGLAICRKIVERYGGRIWVESSPGQGSSFCFTLPSMESEIIYA